MQLDYSLKQPVVVKKFPSSYKEGYMFEQERDTKFLGKWLEISQSSFVHTLDT